MSFLKHLVVFMAVIFCGCTRTTEQSMVISNVTTEYEGVINPGEDLSFPLAKTHLVKIMLTGEIEGKFRIQFSPVHSNSNDKPITETVEFNELSGTAEFDADWYGDAMKIKYVPISPIINGNLKITVRFYAVE